MRRRSLPDINEKIRSRKKSSTIATCKLIPCFCNNCKGAFRDPRIKQSHSDSIEKLQKFPTLPNTDFGNLDNDNDSIHSEEMPELLNFATDKQWRYPYLPQPFVLVPPRESDGEDENEDEDDSRGGIRIWSIQISGHLI